MEVFSPGRESAILEFSPVPIRKGTVFRVGLSLQSPQQTELTIGLRSTDDENKVYLEQPITSQAEWISGQFVFQATVDDPNALFFLKLYQQGIVEIDAFYIEPYRPRTGTVQAITVQDSPNLLPTSSFPDGVHAPWALTNAKSYKTDLLEFGPTGLPSLRVSGAGASLSVPFFSEGSGDYTISFYLKSTKENQSFSIILSPPGENQQVYPFHQTITADTEWRRYSSTVPLESTVEGFYLAHLISHSGDPAWIDGMQVEKGAELRTLARTAPVEIVAQPHVPNGVSFEDENLVVRITLYGNLGRAALMKATLFDIHGRNFTLRPLNVKGTKPIRRNLVIEPIGESPLGSYRLG